MKVTLEMLLPRLPSEHILGFYGGVESFAPIAYAEKLNPDLPVDHLNNLLVAKLSHLLRCPKTTFTCSIICIKDCEPEFDVSSLSPCDMLLMSDTLPIDDVVSITNRIISSFNLFSDKLLSLFISHSTCQELVDLTSSYIGNPIRICDPYYRVIAQTSTTVLDSLIWQESEQTGFLSTSPLFSAEYAALRNAAEQSDTPFLCKPDHNPHPVICYPLKASGKWLGWASIIGYNKPFNTADKGVLSFSMPLIVETIMRSRHAEPYHTSDDTFLKIVLDYGVDDKNLERIAGIFSIPQSLYYQIIVLNPTSGLSFGACHLAELEAQFSEHSSPISASIFQGKIVLFYGYNANVPLTNPLDGLDLPKMTLNIGISDFGKALTSIKELYSQAMAAIEQGAASDSGKTVFFFRDYKLDRIIDCYASDPSIVSSMHSALPLLRDYDESNGTELYKTLRAYVYNNFRHKKTAEALFIHRNTLSYRLDQISSLLNINFDDPDTVLHIALTFKIFERQNKANV